MPENTNILSYTILGKGNSVVFLHGFLEDKSMWEEIVAHLTSVQSICIDLPGHGSSSIVKDLSLTKIAQLVKNTLASLEVTKFSIVGHSLGGYVALEMAEDNNLQIDDIVLLHSHPWADSEEKKMNRKRTAKVVAYDKGLFINEAIPNLYHSSNQERLSATIVSGIKLAKQMDEQAIIESLYAMSSRTDKTEILSKWGERLHIIQGEFDSLIDTDAMQTIAKEYGNKYHLIKGIGHMGHQEAPEEVFAHLNFLNITNQI